MQKNLLITCGLSLDLINIDIIIDVGGCEFECVEIYHLFIFYELEKSYK